VREPGIVSYSFDRSPAVSRFAWVSHQGWHARTCPLFLVHTYRCPTSGSILIYPPFVPTILNSRLPMKYL